MDEIRLNNLVVPCTAGNFPKRRIESSDVVFDISLFIDTRKAALECDISYSIDYIALGAEIKFILQNVHCNLLETAMEAVAAYILSTKASKGLSPDVRSCTLEARKPDFLGSGSFPSIRITRCSEDFSEKIINCAAGRVQIYHQSRDSFLYAMLLSPNTATPVFLHNRGKVSEMPLNEGLLLQGNIADAGLSRIWPSNFPRQYKNPTGEDKRILCISGFGPENFKSIANFGNTVWELKDLPKGLKRHYYAAFNNEGIPVSNENMEIDTPRMPSGVN
ncbi:MAG: dihydroneopterin aldolase [Oligoflexales bacterium]|nr:dihydroneopterin aldolase [Oligoflexales bacterium]